MPTRPDDSDNNWCALRQLEVESLYEMIRGECGSNENAQDWAETLWALGGRANMIHLWAKQPASSN